jgi:putative addiction module component (TIGR02574 family)
LVIIGEMSTHFHDVEKQARALSSKEKAALARQLIEELDLAADADAEQLWIDEAQRRYEAYLKGELEALPGDEVMTRARNRLK